VLLDPDLFHAAVLAKSGPAIVPGSGADSLTDSKKY
jgi:hypothetical protein